MCVCVCVLIFIYLFRLSHSACRILVPNQGLTLALDNERTVLTSGPPGNSLNQLFSIFYFIFFRAIKLFEGMMKTMNLLPRKIHINIAAAAAKSLQSCPTLCDPTDGSHQAPPSLGFSRQEHWNGLPFPSPMHENEKWKGSRSVVSDS